MRCLFHVMRQIQQVDEFIQHVNIAMRQRHEYQQLSIVIDRIESYDAIDLPSDECLKVAFCLFIINLFTVLMNIEHISSLFH